jgi:hypothetical protein
MLRRGLGTDLIAVGLAQELTMRLTPKSARLSAFVAVLSAIGISPASAEPYCPGYQRVFTLPVSPPGTLIGPDQTITHDLSTTPVDQRMYPCDTISVSVTANNLHNTKSAVFTLQLWDYEGTVDLAESETIAPLSSVIISEPESGVKLGTPYNHDLIQLIKVRAQQFASGSQYTVTYTLTVTLTSRPGYNRGGDSSAEALSITVNPLTVYGSMRQNHHHWFKAQLQPKGSVTLSGTVKNMSTSASAVYSTQIQNSAGQQIYYSGTTTVPANSEISFQNHTYTNTGAQVLDVFILVRNTGVGFVERYTITIQAQIQCPDQPSGLSDAVVLSLKQDVIDGCVVSSGGFIRDGTQYKLHINAGVNGSCQARVWNPSTSTCQNNGAAQTRWIRNSVLNAGSSSIGLVTPLSADAYQSYNTDPPTNTSHSGQGWSTSILGTQLFGSDTIAHPTSCNFVTPVSRDLTMHVLDCKPEWFLGGTPPNPTVNFHGPSSGEIKIAIPSSAFEAARVPAEQAAADWATALGRTVTVQAGYTTCTSTDPLCIQLKDDQGTQPDDPEGCASLGTATYDPSTGVWQGSTSVRFEPNWTGGHPDNLRHTIAHELGHYFGLFNRLHASCSATNTIMHYVDCYASQPPPTGTSLGPTPSDVSPILNSTYGNQIRNSCGW